MTKSGEISYLKQIGDNGRKHALNKPFSDQRCGHYLYDLGILMNLLPPAPANILDLGAGSGWTSCFFAMRGYNVIAQDISNDMIELLNKNINKYQVNNIISIIADFENMDFSNEFDAAIFYDCLHHAEDERMALTSAYNALKNNGILITAEPGAGHAQTEASIKAIKHFGVTEKDMPPSKIIELALSIGFASYKIYARRSDPILLAPTKTTNLLKHLLNAWFSNLSRLKTYNNSNFVVLTK